MIPHHTIYFWLIVTNITAVALLVWIRIRLPPSAERRAFSIFLPSYLCWSNPLLIVQFFDTIDSDTRLLTQLVYAGGTIFVATLGLFVITIAAPSELRRMRFWLFQINYAFLFICSFLGLIEGGIERVADGTLQPLPGVLFHYFNFSMLAFGIYFLSVCWMSYRKTGEDLLACQLKTIFWTGLLSFMLLLVTNSLLPAALGDYRASPVGTLWLLLFFAGIAYILVSGPALLVGEAFSKLVNSPLFQNSSNLKTLRYFLGSIFSAANNSLPTCRTLAFQAKDGSVKEIYLTQSIQTSPRKPISIHAETPSPDQGATLSAQKAGSPLGGINTHHDALIKSQSFLKPYLSQGGCLSDTNSDSTKVASIDLPAIISNFRTQINENNRRYGKSIIVGSQQFRSTLLRLEELTASPGAIVISGEVGTGKTLLSHIAAHLRGISKVNAYSCAFDDMSVVEEAIATFISADSDTDYALILENIDRLAPEKFSLLSELFSSQFATHKLLVLTCGPGFIPSVKALPYGIIKLYEKRHILIPPLRDRREDIYCQLVYFVDLLSIGKVKTIEEAVIQRAMNHYWRGNSGELRVAVSRAVALTSNDCISEILLHTEPAILAEKKQSTLTIGLKDKIQQLIDGASND